MVMVKVPPFIVAPQNSPAVPIAPCTGISVAFKDADTVGFEEFDGGTLLGLVVVLEETEWLGVIWVKGGIRTYRFK